MIGPEGDSASKMLRGSGPRWRCRFWTPVPAFAGWRRRRQNLAAGVRLYRQRRQHEDLDANRRGPRLRDDTMLEPLAAFRERMLVPSGLDNKPGLALPGEPAGGHGRIGGSF